MAQTVTTEKKETTAKELASLKATYETQYNLIYRYARTREVRGMPAGNEAEAKAKYRDPFVKTLTQINDALRPYNPAKDATGRGSDYITIPAGTARLDTLTLARIKVQTDRALNNAIDNATFGEELSAAMTASTPTKTISAPATQVPTRTDTTKTVIPQPAEKRATTAVPESSYVELKRAPEKKATSSTTAVPVKVTVPQIAPAERERIETIIQDLSRIISAAEGNARTPGPTAAARDHAYELQSNISNELQTYDLSNSPQATPLDAKQAARSIDNLKTYVSSYNSDRAIQLALKAARDVTNASVASKEGTNPLMRELSDLNKTLSAILADSKRTQDVKASAERMIKTLPDVWLLSEDEASVRPDASSLTMKVSPRWEMYFALRTAANTLNTGDVDLAKRQYTYAIAIFDREQALLGQRMGNLQTIAAWNVEAVKKLPDSSQLRTQEKLDGINTVATGRGEALKNSQKIIEYNRYYHALGTGVDNGSGSLVAAASNRLEQVGRQIATAKGRYSYTQVADMEQALMKDSRAISDLVGMWSYAFQNGLAGKDATARQDAWKAYSTAAAIMVNPSISPYEFYPPELRTFLIAQYRNATGNYLEPEKKVRAALMSNPRWMTEDALYGVYRIAYQFAPVNAATEPVVQTLASLNSAWTLWAQDYAQYAGHANVDMQLQDARYYVQTAASLLSASGVQQTDQRIIAANKWLGMEQPTEKEGKIAYADALWSMALDMVATRAAETWILNTGTIGRADLTKEQFGQAREIINASLRRFEHCYKVPEAGPTQFYSYPDLARDVASNAIHLLAPAIFGTTEVHAGYEVLFKSEAAKSHVLELRVGAKGAQVDLDKMREAQLTDRDVAVEAARNAEAGHIRMLASKRAGDFERPVLPAPSQAFMTAYGLLSPDVVRKPLLIEASRPSPTVAIADRHVDHQERGHLDAPVYPQGALFAEVYRQEILNGDKNVPELLRNFDASVFTAGMRNISLNYGKAATTPEAQITAINNGFMQILDLKLQQLEKRLAASIEVEIAGRKATVPIRTLVTSGDAKRYFVVRAVESLDELKALRTRYGMRIGTSLFNGSVPMTPVQSIMTAEQALASLDDKNLEGMVLPETPVTTSVPADAIAIIKDTRTRGHFVYASPTNMTWVEGGKAYTHAQAAKMHPDAMVVFNYFWYQEQAGQEFLLNPAYRSDPEHAYIGVVMDNVVLTDGTKIGRAVVRAEPTPPVETRGPAYAGKLSKGRVAPEDVLYRIKKGTDYEPEMDATLNANMSMVSRPKSASLKDVSATLTLIADIGSGKASGNIEQVEKASPASDRVVKFSESRAVVVVTPQQEVK
ncbi:MAG: hypothetical protein PHV13_02000 [Candidatus ainarchaeum sp.]|nr:hypothetical protein [Candidatus ainarchaeum sp.]